MLMPDNQSLTVEALIALSQQLAATPTEGGPKEAFSPPLFVVPALALWVNGLWIGSLCISIISAVCAMLVKQWLLGYVRPLPQIAQERATTRHSRFVGLRQFCVPTIISALPLCIHVSAFAFLAGLVLFISQASTLLAWVTGICVIAAFLAYILSALMPLVYHQCPYRSPLTTIYELFYAALSPLRRGPWMLAFLKACRFVSKWCTPVRASHRVDVGSPSFGSPSFGSPSFERPTSAEGRKNRDRNIEGDALIWLGKISTVPDTVTSVILAFGAWSYVKEYAAELSLLHPNVLAAFRRKQKMMGAKDLSAFRDPDFSRIALCTALSFQIAKQGSLPNADYEEDMYYLSGTMKWSYEVPGITLADIAEWIPQAEGKKSMCATLQHVSLSDGRLEEWEWCEDFLNYLLLSRNEAFGQATGLTADVLCFLFRKIWLKIKEQDEEDPQWPSFELDYANELGMRALALVGRLKDRKICPS